MRHNGDLSDNIPDPRFERYFKAFIQASGNDQ